jgi:bifunctional DNA-binding transcriptional regulator/antitoxin component of YhaV-PrlF toxin-antitoxin module
LRGIGVVTETVEIDGTYRVVIPYTNRKFAETAAEDYPNTIIFE